MQIKIHSILFSDDEISQLTSVLSTNYNNFVITRGEWDDLFIEDTLNTPDILLLNEPCQLFTEEKIEQSINSKPFPVIIFSEIENNYKTINSGAILFVQKPFVDYVVCSTIKSALNLKKILDSNIKKEIEIRKKMKRSSYRWRTP